MGIGARSKRCARSLRSAERKRSAFELSCRGWSQPQIAKELGIGQPRVSQLIAEGVAEHPVKALEEYRSIRNAQLDAQRRRLEEDLETLRGYVRSKKDASIVDRICDLELALLKNGAEQDKVNGLPKRLELSGVDGAPLAPTKIEIVYSTKLDPVTDESASQG